MGAEVAVQEGNVQAFNGTASRWGGKKKVHAKQIKNKETKKKQASNQRQKD